MCRMCAMVGARFVREGLYGINAAWYIPRVKFPQLKGGNDMNYYNTVYGNTGYDVSASSSALGSSMSSVTNSRVESRKVEGELFRDQQYMKYYETEYGNTGYDVKAGSSAWGSSMPKGTIHGVRSKEDLKLDDVAGGYFRNLQRLTDEQAELAQAIYSPYRRAVEDTNQRAVKVEEVISDKAQAEYMYASDYTLKKDVYYGSPGYESKKTPFSYEERLALDLQANGNTLDKEGDRYLRAQIHERRHEDAIKRAFDDNRSRFPDTYQQPKSEWWFNNKKG